MFQGVHVLFHLSIADVLALTCIMPAERLAYLFFIITLCRVGAGMYRLKRTYRHLCIYLRGFNTGMAQHRLYPPKVCAVLQHLRGHRMAEQVTASVRNQPGGFHIVTDGVGDAVWSQPLHAIERHEQRLTVRVNQQLRPDVVQVTLDPPQRALAHRNHPVLFTFALNDGQDAAVRIHAEHLKPRRLAAPYARRPQHLHQRPVPDAAGGGQVRLRQHLLHLGHAQDVARQAFLQSRQFKVCRRVRQQQVLLRHPAEPHLHRLYGRALGPGGQWVAVTFAVLVPKSKQKLVSEMLDAVIMQAQQTRSDG